MRLAGSVPSCTAFCSGVFVLLTLPHLYGFSGPGQRTHDPCAPLPPEQKDRALAVRVSWVQRGPGSVPGGGPGGVPGGGPGSPAAALVGPRRDLAAPGGGPGGGPGGVPGSGPGGVTAAALAAAQAAASPAAAQQAAEAASDLRKLLIPASSVSMFTISGSDSSPSVRVQAGQPHPRGIGTDDPIHRHEAASSAWLLAVGMSGFSRPRRSTSRRVEVAPLNAPSTGQTHFG